MSRTLVLFMLSAGFVIGCSTAPPPVPLRDSGPRPDAGPRDSAPPSGDALPDAFVPDATPDAAGTDTGPPDAGCSTDADRDGDPSVACGGRDCDDTNREISGVTPEICGNAVDENCSGEIDDHAASDAAAITCTMQILCNITDCFLGYPSFDACVTQQRAALRYYHCADEPALVDDWLACTSYPDATLDCSMLHTCLGNAAMGCECGGGALDCGDPVCTDTTTSVSHCGACGNGCSFRQGCVASTCVPCGVLDGPCCFGLASESCDSGLTCNGSFICRP